MNKLLLSVFFISMAFALGIEAGKKHAKDFGDEVIALRIKSAACDQKQIEQEKWEHERWKRMAGE